MSSSHSPPSLSTFKQLRIAIVGGGIGGLSAAIALRRAGHVVEVFERRSLADVEISSSLSCGVNGTRWFREWKVDISVMKPVILQKFVVRDWETGHVLSENNLHGYEATWGDANYVIHRKDLHKGLLRAATAEEGLGTPCKVVFDHVCESVDCKTNTVTFKSGRTVVADLIIGADGVGSVIRKQIGITADRKSAPQTCYRCNIRTEEIERLGLPGHSREPAIHSWGGVLGKNGRSGYYKFVTALCSGGDVMALYCFMPSELTNHHQEGFEFKEVPAEEILRGHYKDLDPNCVNLLKHSADRTPWRMYIHQPYEYWRKGKVCIMGDAAHPMMPHQAQGACQAIEDAAALGIIFSDKYGFTNDVEAGLVMYEKIRKGRATKLQQASAEATENVGERLGFADLTPRDAASPAAAESKMTTKELNSYDMHAHVANEVQRVS